MGGSLAALSPNLDDLLAPLGSCQLRWDTDSKFFLAEVGGNGDQEGAAAAHKEILGLSDQHHGFFVCARD